MDDAEVYMALALNNMQGELHPLEVGLHALRSGLKGREYAKRIGISEQTLSHRIKAARVIETVTTIGNKDPDRWLCFAEIHAAPQWLWPALATKLQEETWTVEVTRKTVQSVSEKVLTSLLTTRFYLEF